MMQAAGSSNILTNFYHVTWRNIFLFDSPAKEQHCLQRTRDLTLRRSAEKAELHARQNIKEFLLLESDTL